jgi:hypothetical protein
VRRTVATLLVVASPLVMAAPVGARDAREAVPAATAPAPAAVQAVVPAVPVMVAPPAVAATPAVPAPATTAVRPAVKAVRAKAPTAATGSDAAYAAQLQADLCQARTIFCGLDRGGHYPAG